MTNKEKEILSEYYDKTIKKGLDEYLNYRIIEQEIKKELFKNKDLKNIVITRVSINDVDIDNPYCIVDFADVKNNNSITYSFPLKTKVLLFLSKKGKLASEYVDAKLNMKQVADRLFDDKDFGKISKENLEKLKNIRTFDATHKIREEMNKCCDTIEKVVLEELEYQKRKNADLLETINCIKNHAVIKKAKGLGTEIIASFHSSDDDFEKVGWVFDIIKY